MLEPTFTDQFQLAHVPVLLEKLKLWKENSLILWAITVHLICFFPANRFRTKANSYEILWKWYCLFIQFILTLVVHCQDHEGYISKVYFLGFNVHFQPELLHCIVLFLYFNKLKISLDKKKINLKMQILKITF